MEYAEAANFLFDLRRFRMKPGTESIVRLLDYLENPHEEPAYIQVAGSNGKGSTARMLEGILAESGYSVGLYTSPHLDDLRDRIRVNDRPIPKSAVCEFTSKVQEYVIRRAVENEAPTFFEVVTAMALWYFGREGVDYGVLEVGIGGRLDATSAVNPLASAVTSVSLEHTDLLGKTVTEIARDKAHVAVQDAPLVTAATGEALTAIREVAGDVRVVGFEQDTPDILVAYGGIDGIESPVTVTGDEWEVDTRLGLLGPHQALNAGIACELARQTADVTAAAMSRGLRGAHWPGRLELLQRDPLLMLDGAHNPTACEMVAAVLDDVEYEELILVFGAMHDKAHAEMVRKLPTPSLAIPCQPDVERAEDRAVLASVFRDEGIDVRPIRAVETAVYEAIEAASSDDCVLVTGSLYTVGEARSAWTRLMIPRRTPTVDAARTVLGSAHVSSGGIWRMRGKGVHRVVKTRVRPRQARYLKEEMLSIGGECAISGIAEHEEEQIDVVLMGTLAEFNRLLEKLDGQPYGLTPFGRDLQRALGIRIPPEPSGYPWQEEPCVMGILNVTPDSFHDGGLFDSSDEAVARAREMVEEGAAIIDIGGESTRPGADPVSVEEELARVIPVVEGVADLDAVVSIDTRKAVVAEAALGAGAAIVNDVSGLADPAMRFVVAEHGVPIVVTHSIDTPVIPERAVTYDDIVDDVLGVLRERVLLAEQAGVDRSEIIVDPGIGFGKTARESFELIARINEFEALGCPVLVGHSHKSMFDALGYGPGARGAVTVAVSALAVAGGADIIRVHDVGPSVAAVAAAQATRWPSS